VLQKCGDTTVIRAEQHYTLEYIQLIIFIFNKKIKRLITDALICITFFRLHAGQGVLSVPSAAVVRGHREPLCVAVRNEYQDIKQVDRI
jgi:UDP-N-acetylglucosamine transferase subunit ALG13